MRHAHPEPHPSRCSPHSLRVCWRPKGRDHFCAHDMLFAGFSVLEPRQLIITGLENGTAYEVMGIVDPSSAASLLALPSFVPERKDYHAFMATGTPVGPFSLPATSLGSVLGAAGPSRTSSAPHQLALCAPTWTGTVGRTGL